MASERTLDAARRVSGLLLLAFAACRRFNYERLARHQRILRGAVRCEAWTDTDANGIAYATELDADGATTHAPCAVIRAR
jgi:hypothetical protein